MKAGGIVTLDDHDWFPALIIELKAETAFPSSSQIVHFDVLTVLCPDQEIRTINSVEYHGMRYHPPADHLYTGSQNE